MTVSVTSGGSIGYSYTAPVIGTARFRLAQVLNLVVSTRTKDTAERDMAEADIQSVPEAIRRLVEQHQVCWEVWPEPHYRRDGTRVQVGYILRLSGIHDHPTRTPQPGCDECRLVFDHLRRIADWITPKEERDSRYEVSIFDSAIRYSTQRHFRAEVSLSLKILHKGQWDAPIDPCEVRCLREMESNLKRLGAHKGSLA